MKQRLLWIAVAGAAAGGLLAWLLITGGRSPAPPAPAEAPIVELATPTPSPEQRIILLFAGNDGMLHPELRTVPLPQEVDVRLRVVMAELLKGPSQGLAPVIAYPAEVRAVFLDSQGVAFVDLSPPPDDFEGSLNEILLVYGVVDSILLNCPELSRVQLLFGGHEVDTLTGHLDLSKPLPLNKRFIASS